MDALFRHIHSLGLKTLLLSDNSAARIERSQPQYPHAFIAEAGKARPAAYRRALRHAGPAARAGRLRRRPAVRDIRGANRAGLDSILVDFIRLPGETHYGKSGAGKAILWFYHRDPRRRDRLDGIGK